MQFSLIIPSYNNSAELEKELPLLLSYLAERKYQVEVLIVNDGSPQKEALEKFCATHHFTLINHSKNMGKGAAVKTGMLAARNDVRIFTDADIPFQYSIFDDIIAQFASPDTMMVCGDRRKSDYFSRTPAVRRMGSTVFSGLVNFVMFRNMGDTQCGIKAFRSAVVKRIFPSAAITGFAADIEWIYLAGKAGFTIKWVNAEFRNAGESSVVFWKQAVKMLADVIKLRMRI